MILRQYKKDSDLCSPTGDARPLYFKKPNTDILKSWDNIEKLKKKKWHDNIEREYE